MKKLFSIFSALLVASSMQATVTTENISLSSFSVYTDKVEEKDVPQGTFNSETLSFSDFKAWGGGQIWYGEGESALDISGYSYICLELTSAIATDVKLTIEYDSSEPSSSQLIVKAGRTKSLLKVTGNKVKKLEIKNESGINNVSFRISSIYGVRPVGRIDINRPLWKGENAFGYWVNRISVDPFARVHEYDEMVITYTKESDPQCQIKIRETNAFLDFVGDYVDVSGETQASFLLSAADVAAIKSNGFYLNGKYMTITDVRIVSHRTLASEEKVVGGWDNRCEIDAGMLADLQIGNNICVLVTNIASGEYQRVSLYSGWSNSDLLVGCEHFFGAETASGESPLIVRFPVTGSMKQQLGSHNLLVRGCYYTMTDVYVEEGTPVAETGVNGYLTVSAAGMATFMLPFNVPSLPTGVQAYELTNDGSEEIVATEVNELEADKPVLIVAAKGEYKFISEEGASDDISGKTGTYANGALVGTYQTIDPLAQTTDDKYNYLLQNGTDGVAFYQVLDGSCSLGAYRAYLSCGYNANAPKPGMPPRKSMRIVFRTDETTGLGDVQGDNVKGTKVIEDGQLYIKYKGTKYNVQGQKVR